MFSIYKETFYLFMFAALLNFNTNCNNSSSKYKKLVSLAIKTVKVTVFRLVPYMKKRTFMPTGAVSIMWYYQFHKVTVTARKE